MKSGFSFAGLIVIFVCFSLKAADALKLEERYVDTAKGCSLVPPTGWKPTNVNGITLVDPDANGGILIMTVEFSGTLKEFADLAEAGHKKLGQSEFKTEAGKKVLRFVTEVEVNLKRNPEMKALLRQIFYYVNGPGKIFIVLCSSPASDGGKSDTLFDTCMKTFRIEAAEK